MVDFCRNFNLEVVLQILIYRCVAIEAPSKINAQTCRDRRPRLSENEGCLLSKCRVSFPREIYPFVLGQSRTPVPTGLYVIFAGGPYRNNSINPNLSAYYKSGIYFRRAGACFPPLQRI